MKEAASEESTSDETLQKMRDLVSRDGLLYEEGLIFRETADRYNQLEGTSKKMQEIMKKDQLEVAP